MSVSAGAVIDAGQVALAPTPLPDILPGETGARIVLERAAPTRPRCSMAFELVVDDVPRGVPLTV